MNRYLRTALALALFACACFITNVQAGAQSVYGSIFGTVTDSTGAAIPNATVTVKARPRAPSLPQPRTGRATTAFLTSSPTSMT
jgi:hypothetical protein